MNKTILSFVVLIIGIIALLFWARGQSEPAGERAEGRRGFWQDTDVKCLLLGHQNLAQHIHPALSIIVDGVPEEIPADIGNNTLCMAEAHTHDGTGTLHLESVDPERVFILSDLFSVWDQPLQREGYALTATINGQIVPDIGTRALADQDRIVLTYTTSQEQVSDAAVATSSEDGGVVDLATTTED